MPKPNDHMPIEYTMFGKTKLVRAECWNYNAGEDYDLTLWVERGEDMYALSSTDYKDKKVAIVHRRDWLRAKEI